MFVWRGPIQRTLNGLSRQSPQDLTAATEQFTAVRKTAARFSPVTTELSVSSQIHAHGKWDGGYAGRYETTIENSWKNSAVQLRPDRLDLLRSTWITFQSPSVA